MLTMLGIMIGVASIIAVVAIGQGGSEVLKSQLAGSGNNTLEIQFQPDEEVLSNLSINDSPTFTQEDLFQLRKIPEISHVITTNTMMDSVMIGDQKINTNIVGIIHDYFAVHSIHVIKGRMLSKYDFSQSNNVVMINEKAEKEFFQNRPSIGSIIAIKGQPFQVVGVYKTGNSFGLDTPEVLLPISIWPALFGTENIQSVTIQTKNVNQLELAGKKAVNMLNHTKSSDLKGKYVIFNLETLKQGISKVTNIMTMIVAGIASISLLVGGIGVMNMMLVSVTERTREIGIRKALGASRGKILLQFLIESMMLTLLGGMIGIGLGVGGAYLISVFAHWPPLVSPQVVIGGVLFSMILGIIFGLIPANKAAKLEPIEALRYE
jgi:putative ABC transport system permease protein